MRKKNNDQDQVLKGGGPAGFVPDFHVALVEPEIPQNTGNIGRTCIGFRADLHLVEPMAFEITDRKLKRAGLDYWPHLKWQVHSDWDALEQCLESPQRVFYFSAFADRLMYDVEFEKGDWFVFGKETKGLPESLMAANAERLLKLPILGPIRGYNVSTAVAMVLSEAHRQLRVTEAGTRTRIPSL